jgi:putative phosphoesterase
MKVAVMSDSHRKTSMMKDAIELLKSHGAQYIVHAGDLEIKENLELLKNSNLIYTSVFGNNDYDLIQYQNDYNINQEPYYFTIKKETFKLMHIPSYMSADSNIVIYGHTHDFSHEYKNDTLYLNPGEICARNKPLSQCVLLEIFHDKFVIDYFYKEVLHNNVWETKQTIYKR